MPVFNGMGLKMWVQNGILRDLQSKGNQTLLKLGPGRYWKKKVSGKQLYFKTPNSAAGYEAALAEWAKSQEPPEPPDPHENRPFLRQVCEWYENHGDPDGRAKRIRIYLDARYTSKEKRFLAPAGEATDRLHEEPY